MWTDPKRQRAAQMLVLANACWALSFPTTKALALTQEQLLGNPSTWFLASLLTVFRFGLATLVLLAFSARSIGKLTRSELEQVRLRDRKSVV